MRLSIALLTLIAASPAFAKDKDADAVVREVNKGTYMKSGIGVTPYFVKSQATGGSLLSPVMTVDLSVGSDIVDKERLSMAVEAQFSQQLQDGRSDSRPPSCRATCTSSGSPPRTRSLATSRAGSALVHGLAAVCPSSRCS
jgi:hypothetical protein